MNVIVSNLNSNRFVNLDIDVIKSITGEFTVEEIVQSFSNFFFNRMFLDVTAIKDYTNVNLFKNLSIGLDVSKVILFLNNDVADNEYFISKLISFGIYNFAKTEEELKYLYDNPNSYKDVAHLQKNDDILGASLNNNSNVNDNSNGSNVAVNKGPKVIGFRNFTNHAGATSLIYMLKKQLSASFMVAAIEVNKRDFLFFNDKDMVSCRANELGGFLLKYKDYNAIFIDLNDLDLSTTNNVCSEVIYLMEASTLMINKAVMLDSQCFNKISTHKVLLNQCLLNIKDVKQLEFETNISFFGVLPPLNDRIDNINYLGPILSKLGFYREKS